MHGHSYKLQEVVIMTNDYLHIASEINTLTDLLADIPADNLIERMSLMTRLDNAKAALGNVSMQPNPKVQLTFRGKPVLGSHGISADFGSEATHAFGDAYTAIAAGFTRGLRTRGPIPDQDKYPLVITNIAMGSFGFEFELYSQQQLLFPEAERAREAMNKLEALLRLSAVGTDDEVAEIIEAVDARAITQVHKFLDVLVTHQAWCGLAYGDTHFQYADYAQIKVSNERLKDDNIHTQKQSFQGEFQGVLPMGRTFEFVHGDSKEVLRGKINIAIEDPDILNRDWLHKPVTIQLTALYVGRGRPRYTLMSLADVLPNDPPDAPV
jgi:hypothetical protein